MVLEGVFAHSESHSSTPHSTTTPSRPTMLRLPSVGGGSCFATVYCTDVKSPFGWWPRSSATDYCTVVNYVSFLLPLPQPSQTTSLILRLFADWSSVDSSRQSMGTCRFLVEHPRSSDVLLPPTLPWSRVGGLFWSSFLRPDQPTVSVK